jgi:hypothetical protein
MMMTADSDQPHILVLHTSCQHHDHTAKQAPPASSDTNDATSEQNRRSAMVDELLHSIPIACDMLLLPEIPTSITTTAGHPDDAPAAAAAAAATPDLVEFVQNRFHPCGNPNVLVLENLSWKQVLLSLTSCAMIYEQDTHQQQFVLLPVDPVPSTFDFRLATATSSSSSAAAADLSTTDLHLVFDVTQVRLQLEEILLLQDEQDEHDQEQLKMKMNNTAATRPTQEESLDTVAGADFSPKMTDDLPVPEHSIKTLKEGRHSSYSPPRFDRGPINNSSSSTTRLDQELEALHRVQAIMEQDAANLDRLLQVLSWIGLGLFLTLVWSGYQLYRAKRDDARTQKLRKSVERKLLLHSALAQTPMLRTTTRRAAAAAAAAEPTRAGEPASSTGSRQTMETNTESARSDELCTPRIDNRSRSRISAAQPITPTRLDFSLGCAGQEEKSSSSPCSPSSHVSSRRQGDDITTGVNQCNSKNSDVVTAVTGKSRLQSVLAAKRAATGATRMAARHNSSKPEDTKNPFASLAPAVTATATTRRQQEQRIASSPIRSTGSTITSRAILKNDHDKDVTLSPCSQLAANWSARKTTRRSHRKNKKSSHLSSRRPAAASAASSQQQQFSSGLSVPMFTTNPIGNAATTSTITGQGSSLILCAPLPLRPIGGQQQSLVDVMATTTSVPATQQSLFRMPDPIEKKNPFCSEKDEVQGTLLSSSNACSNKSPSSGGGPPIPELVCSTPGSSDSFVDDYW